MLDAGLSTLIDDLDERGMLEDTLVVAVGEFGRSPQRGLSTSRQRATATTAATTGRTASPACSPAAASSAATSTASSDKTGSAPAENPVHPTELLATIYHALGIEPQDDRLQPPQPAARAGEGRSRDGAVCVRTEVSPRRHDRVSEMREVRISRLKV